MSCSECELQEVLDIAWINFCSISSQVQKDIISIMIIFNITFRGNILKDLLGMESYKIKQSCSKALLSSECIKIQFNDLTESNH